MRYMRLEASADIKGGVFVFSIIWSNRVEFRRFHDLRNFGESMDQQ